MSRHGSQILSHKNCRNMVFFIATGVLFLRRDRDGQGKRLGVAIRLGFGQGILCRDRVFYVETELGQVQDSC